jgi:ATP-dependent DNA helicase RecG
MRLLDEELEAMLTDLESDRAERKETFNGDAPEKVRQAVCAFANDLPGHGRPGVAFIGVRDDGMPTNLPITDDLLLTLASIRSDGNFGQPGVTDYRNPHLAEAMKVLGYVQRFGVGIATARRLLAENGNPAPQFDPRDTHVLVTIRRAP